MKLKLALLAAAGTAAFAFGAQAQDETGYYGQVGVGAAFDSDNSDFESDGATRPSPFDSEYDLDTGIAVYGALGKYFGSGVRGEVELSTRTQDIQGIPGDGAGFGGFPVSFPTVDGDETLGDVTATTLMVNIYKDFSIDAAGRINPYIGAGVGGVYFRPEWQNVGSVPAAATDADAASGYRGVVGDKDYTIALQGLAGLTFDFSENMTFDLKYRYLGTGEMEYGGYVNNEFTELETEYRVSELTAGIRFNFGGTSQPAPAPAPEPVQYKTCFDGSRIPVSETCPPELTDPVPVAPDELELTVYFDYDRSNLTDAARSLIAARASEASEYDISSVTVQGNTDTSGSSAYNERLSARRAQVVRDELVANGINASVISVEALGESNPARPTADGVREPLNRRTEVEFEF